MGLPLDKFGTVKLFARSGSGSIRTKEKRKIGGQFFSEPPPEGKGFYNS